MRKYKGISRVENETMMGWFVRVYLNGKVYCNKYFSDFKYEGKRKALSASVDYRNEKTEERNETYPDSRNPRRKILHDKRNKTGVIGVSRTRRKNKNGTFTEYYQATWYPKRGGKAVSKSFSISKFGEKKAFEFAVSARTEAEKKIFKEIEQD